MWTTAVQIFTILRERCLSQQNITLFRSITMLCGTNSSLWNIPHVQFECGEYFAKYCQSHIILLWIWIMLWTIEIKSFKCFKLAQQFIIGELGRGASLVWLEYPWKYVTLDLFQYGLWRLTLIPGGSLWCFVEVGGVWYYSCCSSSCTEAIIFSIIFLSSHILCRMLWIQRPAEPDL
jgi:hypothetical protein